EAMLGHFEEARALVASAAGVYDELGHRLFRAGLSQVAGPIELLARTDALVLHADALVLLGELLSRSGRPDESREAFKDAVGLYERKGHVVAVRQTVEAVGAASSTRV